MGEVLSFISILLLVNPGLGAAIPRMLSETTGIFNASTTSTSMQRDVKSTAFYFHKPNPLVHPDVAFPNDASVVHSSKTTTNPIGVNSRASTFTSKSYVNAEPNYWDLSAPKSQNTPQILATVFGNDDADSIVLERDAKLSNSNFENLIGKMDQMSEETHSAHSPNHRSKRATLTFLGDQTCEYRTYPTIQVYAGTFVRMQSTNFPDKYPNELKCGWKFLAEEGLRIRILCPTFTLAGGDAVYVKDITQRPVLKFDQNLPMTNVTSGTNHIFIGLSTDETDTALGFRCFVRTIEDVNSVTEKTSLVPPEENVPVLVRRVGEPLNTRRDISVIGSSQDTSLTSSQIPSRSFSQIPSRSSSQIPSRSSSQIPLSSSSQIPLSSSSQIPSSSSSQIPSSSSSQIPSSSSSQIPSSSSSQIPSSSSSQIPSSSSSQIPSSSSSQIPSRSSSQIPSRTSSRVLPDASSRNPPQTSHTPLQVEQTSAVIPKSLPPTDSVHQLVHTSSPYNSTPPLTMTTSAVQVAVTTYNNTENRSRSSHSSATSLASSESAQDTKTQTFTSALSSATSPGTSSSMISPSTSSNASTTSGSSSAILNSPDINISTSSTSILQILASSDVMSATVKAVGSEEDAVFSDDGQ
ncbi:CUB domain [Trinorchestia longiramus]|nr:CUB domain [Trinorchestia longiramus]